MPDYHYPPARLIALIVFIIAAVLAFLVDGVETHTLLGLLATGLALFAIS